jgi:preprotein translocase subunit SecG
MNDTLAKQLASSTGIPDAGTRVIYLVTALFVLIILAVLLYAKMKDVDNEVG